jgi:hypothetical protein
MRVSLRVSFWGVGIAREKMEGRERGGEGGERERERELVEVLERKRG